MPHFLGWLHAFFEAHGDMFTDAEQALIENASSTIGPVSSEHRSYAKNHEVAALAVDIYTAKLNQRHAKAMRWLTVALFVAAVVQAVAAVVSVCIAAGIIK